ncbi:PIN domain-containing protein [Microbacterium suaedae]|uniref:PIN domain-containing protein n=1 Tax=Microbacterium suaedae TaxID=2067813 RepID=UPI000DA1BBDB|nr:PIN domain-containing protein [Microbacterium suaedae]
MGRRLIVDTNVLIAIERGVSDVYEPLRDDDEIAIAAVTRAELMLGVELAPDEATARRREKRVTAILDGVDVLDYTARTSDHHAILLAHVRQSGRPRGAHDLVIASHAVETGRALFSADVKARFGDLPGVRTLA